MKRPRRFAFLFLVQTLAIAVALVGRAVCEDTPSEPNDVDRIQGTWVVVGIRIDGAEAEPAIGSKNPPIATIRGNRMQLQLLDMQFRFELDRQHRGQNAPRWWGHFDATMNSVIAVGGWYLYQPASATSDVEWLSIIVKRRSGRRISKFDDSAMRFVMMRTKQTSHVDALIRPLANELQKNDLGPFDALQGHWKMVSVNNSRVLTDITHKFEGEYFIRSLGFEEGGRPVVIEEKVSIASHKNPMHVSFSTFGLGTQLGLMRIEDDRLLLCLSGSGKRRPRSLEPDDAIDANLYVYERWDEKKAQKQSALTKSKFHKGANWVGTIHSPFENPIAATLEILELKNRTFQGRVRYGNTRRSKTTTIRGSINGTGVRFYEKDGDVTILYRGSVDDKRFKGEYGVGGEYAFQFNYGD